MPGIDPAFLAHLNGGGAAPQMPGSSPGGPPGSPPGVEPDGDEGTLDGACMELCEVVKSAAQMAQDLQSQAEMADDLDPAVEQQIAQAADLIMQADQLLDQAVVAMGGDNPDDAGDAGTPPPPPA